MKYLIIGNGIAGISAAESIRKADASAEITVLNSERYYHYSRPRVIEFLSGKADLDKITIKNVDFYEKNRIRLVLLVNVTKIDTASKKVVMEGGIEENYDKLIIAAGAHSFLPPVDGAVQEGVFTLRTIDDAKAIIDYSNGKKTAVVIGGGLLGIEAAMSLSARGLKTTIVEVFDRLLPRQLDKDSASVLQSMLESKGLNFLLPRQALSITRENGKLRINFKDNTPVEGDLVLFSSGIRPNLEIINGTGISTGRGIKVNNFMETSVPGVYAAGDVIEHNGMMYGLWPPAREQGNAAGLNAAGIKTEYTGNVISAKLKTAGIDLASLGSTEAGAGIGVFTKKAGNSFYRVFIKDNKITGAILIGDVSGYQRIEEKMKKGEITGPSESIFNELNLK
jgi:nitrite reductase (NADH) large subunit